ADSRRSAPPGLRRATAQELDPKMAAERALRVRVATEAVGLPLPAPAAIAARPWLEPALRALLEQARY
ncbi:MAG: hypothetical protein ACLP8B_10030, partial [Xanthobacteraceae bacterium]